MTVYRKNITINVGETFSEDLTLLSADGTGVVDLSGFTGESKLRKHPKIHSSQIFRLVYQALFKDKLISQLLVQLQNFSDLVDMYMI